MSTGRRAAAEVTAQVSVALARRVDDVCGDVYGVIVREIPQLRDDKPATSASPRPI